MYFQLSVLVHSKPSVAVLFSEVTDILPTQQDKPNNNVVNGKGNDRAMYQDISREQNGQNKRT